MVVRPTALTAHLALCVLLGVGPGAVPGAVAADGLQLGVALMSDAIWRGYSKSQGRATAALDLTWRGGNGWFASAGVLDRLAGAATGRWEWTFALGHQWNLDGTHAALSDWSLSASVLRYEHSGGPRRINAEYTDLTLAADWKGRLQGVLTLSPDTRTGSRDGWNATGELAWHERLAGRLAFDAGVGWQHNRGIGEPSFGYGSLGLSWGAGPLRATVSRIESRAVTSGAFPRSTAPSRWVFSLVITSS